MFEHDQGWALVTGASGGIGLELARYFAKDGINLVLVARSAERLQDLAGDWSVEYGIQVLPIASDLTQLAAPDEVFAAVAEHDIKLRYLVNNAGVGLFGRYQETSINHEQDMILLNCLALTRLTKLFLPQMLEQGRGNILNVASIAAFQPGPYQSVYFATKSFVLSFSEAIAEDLKDTGVQVTALCPGLTQTGFVKAAAMEHSGFVKRTKTASPEWVASVGYSAFKKGKRIVVPGIFNWITSIAPRFFPRRWITFVVARMMLPEKSV